MYLYVYLHRGYPHRERRWGIGRGIGISIGWGIVRMDGVWVG